MSAHQVRLSNPFVPEAYDLHTRVRLDTWTYTAEETVVLCRDARVPLSGSGSPVIVQLHCAATIQITSVEGAKVLRHDYAAQTLHLELSGVTESTRTHSIKFAFTHTIQEELRGFYQIKYSVHGVEHRMASTHFEPTAARRFFICQDEPAARAGFSLRVSVPRQDDGLTVLSGGPLREKTDDGDWVTWHFETVPQVPPYLTVCVVGHLEKATREVNGVPISLFATPGKLAGSESTLDIAAFAFDYFEKFFHCKFPLPKLDIVAVPSFPIGGMENWGCICCVESILLNEKDAGLEALKRASNLLCHEISHNWFGNLVGIDWWEGLWLKEGFASWCGYHATHVYRPEWSVMYEAFCDVEDALGVDGFAHSHPVEVPIADPADITQIFDSISYNKGMALVFMLKSFLGEEKWGKSVASYINRYQYRNTTTIQLWEALEEASGLPVKEAMNSFTSQMGYPIIRVTRQSPTKLVVQQRPYTSLSSHSTVQDNRTWCVPLEITAKSTIAERVRVVLRGMEPQEVQLPESFRACDMINANASRSSFFRCIYDADTFLAWLKEYPTLSVEDRVCLISDTFAAVKSGETAFDRVGALVACVSKSEHFHRVLQVYATEVYRLARCFDDGALRSTILRKALSFTVPMAETMIRTDARAGATFIETVFDLSPNFLTVEECASSFIVQWLLQQCDLFLNRGEYIPDMLSSALVAGVTYGSDSAATVEKLWDHVKSDTLSDINTRCALRAICSSRDTALVKKVVRHCIAGDLVRSHFGATVFFAMSRNKHLANGEVWTFFKEEFDGINKQWGAGQFRIHAIVDAVASSLTGASQADDFEEFFKRNPLPNARLAIGRAGEAVRLRSQVADRNRAEAAALFA